MQEWFVYCIFFIFLFFLPDIIDIAVWENELYVFYQEIKLKKLTLMPTEMCASWLHSRQNTKLAEDILNHFVISVPPSLQSSVESPLPSFQDALSQPDGSYQLPKVVPKDMTVTSRLSTLAAENGGDRAVPQCTVERPWDALDKPNPVFSSLDPSPGASQKNSNNLQVDRLSLFLKSPDQNGVQPYIENHKSPSEFFESSIQQILIENDESDINPVLTSPENSEEPLDQIFDHEVLHRSAAAFSLQQSYFSDCTFSSGRSTLKPVAIPRPRPSNPSPYNTTLMSPSVYAMLNYTNVTQFEASDQITETEEGSPNLGEFLKFCTFGLFVFKLDLTFSTQHVGDFIMFVQPLDATLIISVVEFFCTSVIMSCYGNRKMTN